MSAETPMRPAPGPLERPAPPEQRPPEEPAPPHRRFLFWASVARGVALFLGAFSLLNILGEYRAPGFDANLWWIDFRALPRPVSRLLLPAAAVAMIVWAIVPRAAPWRRWTTAGLVGALLVVAIANSIVYYRLLWLRAFRTIVPVPFTAVVSLALGLILLVLLIGRLGPRGKRSFLVALFTFLASLVLFPAAQMVCFGNTDYRPTFRNPVDVTVVFGARTYGDGRLSSALADRMATSGQIYRAGLTDKLLLSGGPGDGAVHETQAMRKRALQERVNAEDILLDDRGVNTAATVKNTCAMFRRMNAKRVMVVSHFYHLPRIKMAYQREGWNVLTAPAEQERTLRQLPLFMAREVLALWAYYLLPLAE